LTNERVVFLSDFCYGLFMLLSDVKLLEWADDPELHFLSEATTSCRDDVASAAQTLFCAFVKSPKGKRVVVPRLLKLIQQHEPQAREHELESTVTFEQNTFTPLVCQLLFWTNLKSGALMSGREQPFDLLWRDFYLCRRS